MRRPCTMLLILACRTLLGDTVGDMLKGAESGACYTFEKGISSDCVEYSEMAPAILAPLRSQCESMNLPPFKPGTSKWTPKGTCSRRAAWGECQRRGVSTSVTVYYSAFAATRPPDFKTRVRELCTIGEGRWKDL